jgi:cyclohexadieny/prephenate dehydrogenase
MPPAPDTTGFRCETLAIVGVGLLGGAIALQAKARGIARTVIGLGRNKLRLEAAQRAGVIDCCSTDVQELAGASLAVVCTPVDRIVDDVKVLSVLPQPPSLITDVGSIKGVICETLQHVPRFVGSHPLAGSEKQGFEHAHDVTLDGRVCVVTDSPRNHEASASIKSFWQSLGMQVIAMDARRHDEVLARTSHFPHVAAYALASQLKPGDEACVAGGFRDTTRIAASDPELWASILLMNREAVQKSIAEHERWLKQLSQFLGADEHAPLVELLRAAQATRLRINHVPVADRGCD